MRKRKSAIILIIFILALVSCVVLQNKETMVTAIRKTFFKATTVATGTTGTCNWTLDSDGLLLIEPTNGVSGTMGTFSSSGSFYAYKNQISSIEFNATVYAPANSRDLFTNLNSLTTFNTNNFNTQNVTNMDSMFYGCKALTELDLSNFNTQNVTNMVWMFNGCQSLTELDVSNFNTSNVTNMDSMFANCRLLTELDVSNFNTQNVTRMGWMFRNCELLTELDVSNFNTQNVTDMSQMFYGCKSLTEIDVNSFNTQNVTNMFYMFGSCKALTELDVSNFNTQNVTTMQTMFSGCIALTKLNVNNFNTQNVIYMNGMFENCEKLTELDLSSFNTQNIISMKNMMKNCVKLKSLTLGPDFSFIHKTNELSTYSNPWVKQGTITPTYTSSELMNIYDGSTMAGTYVRINNIRISIKKNDELWNTNNIKVALYQNGTEVYSYSQGEISQEDGTITWYDVASGTYDIYASKDTNNINTMVDTGEDVLTE